MSRSYHRVGPERIPQMSDLFAEVRNTRPSVPLLSHVGPRTDRGPSMQELRSWTHGRTEQSKRNTQSGPFSRSDTNFSELRKAEVRRIHLLRGWVNKARGGAEAAILA